MRLAAQAKMGYYPANPRAIEAILRHVKLPEAGTKGVNILDPCAGKGEAIRQIAEGLHIPQHQVYAVELDKDRAAELKANLPVATADHHVLGPCSFAGTLITPGSFGLAYVNPPFDNELGGGRREEYTFARRAWNLLAPGGTMVLVAPYSAIVGKSSFCDFLDSAFEDARFFAFPDGDDDEGKQIRPYNEVVFIGRRRARELSEEGIRQHGFFSTSGLKWSYGSNIDLLSRVGSPHYWTIVNNKRHAKEDAPTYTLQPAWKPHTFKKIGYLDEELFEKLRTSPLNRLVKEDPTEITARPPLPPGRGHIALLLASGKLDGEVHGEDGSHVVRGTAKKVEYFNVAASPPPSVDPDTGAVTSKEVYSQRVVLVLRAVWQDGEIRTFSDEPKDDDQGEDPDESK